VFSQDTMHGADRAEIDVLVQQRGKDLRRGLVREALRVQMIEYNLPFSRTQSPRWRWTNPARHGRQHAPIERGARHTEGATGNGFADAVTQLQSPHMHKRNKRPPFRKIVLKLPDLDHAKSAV